MNIPDHMHIEQIDNGFILQICYKSQPKSIMDVIFGDKKPLEQGDEWKAVLPENVKPAEEPKTKEKLFAPTLDGLFELIRNSYGTV